nr:hypothetical protein [Vibrio variabilis]
MDNTNSRVNDGHEVLFRRHRTPTIGVILPMLSGFYMGEITSTLRAYGVENGINLIFLRVGHNRDFDIPFAFDHIDGLIVVLHAAASALVEKAVQRGIPVISVAASYAPLEVESLSSDQASGVSALYDHLVGLGHVDIGFCGDLSVNDVRMRFKAFQKRAEHFGDTITKRHILNVSNTALQGAEKRMSAIGKTMLLAVRSSVLPIILLSVSWKVCLKMEFAFRSRWRLLALTIFSWANARSQG